MCLTTSVMSDVVRHNIHLSLNWLHWLSTFRLVPAVWTWDLTDWNRIAFNDKSHFNWVPRTARSHPETARKLWDTHSLSDPALPDNPELSFGCHFIRENDPFGWHPRQPYSAVVHWQYSTPHCVSLLFSATRLDISTGNWPEAYWNHFYRLY